MTFFFLNILILIMQGYINLIKSDSKDIYFIILLFIYFIIKTSIN